MSIHDIYTRIICYLYYPTIVKSWSHFSAVPNSAGPQFSSMKIARRDLVLQGTALSRDSAGGHFSAGIVVRHGTALTKDRDFVL